MMKHLHICTLIVLGAVLFFAATTLHAATPALSWRLNNPRIINNSGTGEDKFIFDIQIKSDLQSNYDHGFARIFFNEDAFSDDEDDFKAIRAGMSLHQAEGTFVYATNLTITTFDGQLVMNADLESIDEDAWEDFFTLEDNTWYTYMSIEATLTNPSKLAEMDFAKESMEGQNFFNNGDGETLYDNPFTFETNFTDLYLGRIYSDAAGWAQPGGLDWSQAVNTSIWDGSATLDAEDAYTHDLRLHTFDDPVNGPILAGLYIEPNAALTVEGELDANNNTGKSKFRTGKDDAVVIAKWDFEDTNQTTLPYTADDGIEENEGVALFNISHAASFEAFYDFDEHSIPGGTRSPFGLNWKVGPSGGTPRDWRVELTTLGFVNLTVSSVQWSDVTNDWGSGEGPDEFIIQWSTDDGDTWANVPGGTITVSNNWTTGAVSNLQLPDDMNNHSNVHIRWVNNTSGKQGYSAIDDIIITGEPLPTYSGIHITSDETGKGSLIHNTEGLIAIIERYIPPPSGDGGSWDDNYGWHFLSSPVSNQAIDNFTVTPPQEYDFYLWSEQEDLWINFKGGNWNTHNTDFSGTSAEGNFATGRGYLVAYQNEQEDFFFEGELNISDITWTGLSLQGDGVEGVYARGWHLLGNPFSSAIELNNMEAWKLQDVSPTVKIWEEESRAYLDVSRDLRSNFIPAAQGFFVQVNQHENNSITIPSSERSHQTDTWYKNQDVRGIFLVARESDKQQGQTKNIVLAEGASQDFDFYHDSRFIGGHAPQFYSIFGQEVVSTKRLPEINSGTVIQLGFVKNNASEFSIDLMPHHLYDDMDVILVDKMLNKKTILNHNPSYGFTSEASDPENRFELRFRTTDDPTNIEEPSGPANQMWVHENTLYVVNYETRAKLEVLDINGRTLRHYTASSGRNSYHLGLAEGTYILRMTTTTGVQNLKAVVH